MRDARRVSPAEPSRAPSSPADDARRARRVGGAGGPVAAAGAGRSESSSERRLLLALLPLRLFLGGTFLYAGLDKLLSPVFLREGGAGSIAQQLAAYTHASPLAPLIEAVALPHPIAIGGLMALAEIAIGLGVVFGLVYRPAAVAGFLVAALFFLTASWGTQPYYYGPDLPYAAGFLTLALVGRPGPYSAAATVESWFTTYDVYGRPERPDVAFSPERRAFLQAAVVGAAAVGLAAVTYGASHVLGLGDDIRSGAGTGVDVPNPGAGSTGGAAASGSSAAGASSGSGSIGTLQQLQQNGSLDFTDPSTGDPGIAVQVNGQLAAYDATCTHQGCPVSYVSDQKVFECPCHGAVFDATNHASVVQGPARQPLAPIAVHVDAQGNVILG